VSAKADLAAFLERIGYSFTDPNILDEALTHSSLSGGGRRDNQRLEFLGDRVLGLVMAEALLDADPSAVEGKLAPRLNAMVRKETCAEVAADIGLGTVMKLGRSETMSGGRRKLAVLGDGMEALIAAVYIDGGFDVARTMILRLWGDRIATAEDSARDAKTALQEWAQARGLPPPDYVEKDRKGPDHAPLFVVAVKLQTGEGAEATARSKRAAQHEAAALLLAELEAS